MIDKYALALLAMFATQMCHGVTQCAQQCHIFGKSLHHIALAAAMVINFGVKHIDIALRNTYTLSS